jgi:predicted O-linked N-acetylglucosamine transferase (SPINDLY family)
MKAARKPPTGFDSALEHHRAGRLARAEALYLKVIENDAQHDQVLFLLGALCLASQRLEQALSFCQRAAALSPNNPQYLSNFGEALRRQGQLEAAAEVLTRAVALRPELPESSFNLAMTLEDLGHTEAALTCLIQAADVAPERFEIQHRLARALVKVGDRSRAVAHYQAALALAPQSLDALLALSAALRALKRSDGAIAMAKRALALAPDSARAHCELARALAKHERDRDLASVLEHCHAALKLDDELVDAHFELACALVDLGMLGEGLEHFRAVLRLSPGHVTARSNIAYLSVFDPDSSPGTALQAAEDWAQIHAAPLALRAEPHRNERSPQRRLRVGYLGIFQEHAQAFFLAPLFAHHDHLRFEVFGYGINPQHDAVTARLRGHLDHFRDASALKDAETAELIRNDAIDVLIDFNMHMANSRLCCFAERPAPVQICWLAYPGTTGLPAMDYRITDEAMDPDGAAHALYSERSLLLPDAFWCYDPLSDEPAVTEPPALTNGFVTFGCLNTYWKTNAALFALWANVLKAVPDSRFVLLTPTAEAKRRALLAFEKGGIVASRIECVPRRSRRDYLAGHAAFDIALDTLPYSGHTTTLDALWMGVPVLTLVGKTAAGRAGLGVMRCVGLPELVTETERQFVERAQELSRDLPRLRALRAGLREQLEASVAMDGARFAKNFETALRGAWQAWCERNQ